MRSINSKRNPCSKRISRGSREVLEKSGKRAKYILSKLHSFGRRYPEVRNRKELTALLLDKDPLEVTPKDYQQAGVHFAMKYGDHRVLVVERKYGSLVYVHNGKRYALTEGYPYEYHELLIITKESMESNLGALRSLRSRF